MGLRITVPPEGKVIINSAVIQNRGKAEADLFVLNHANVIREKNIMQAEEATTPARRAYFLMQAIIMDNAPAKDPRVERFVGMVDDLTTAFEHPEVVRRLGESRRLASEAQFYRAMMALKPVIKYEDAVLALGEVIQVETQVQQPLLAHQG